MKNALILHGKPSKEEYNDLKVPSPSNSHWIPWLQNELNNQGILTQTPELPKPYKPVYKDWFEVFNNFEINKDSMLIGHSCGGGFLVRWLSETNQKIDKLVLVAPWLDPKGETESDFFKFEIDTNLKEKANKIHILSSTNDFASILESVAIIKNTISGYDYHEFQSYGHFTYGDLHKREFPEILQIVLN